MASYGTRFAESVGDYLRANGLVNREGQPSLGKVNASLLADLADRFEQAEIRRGKAERSKKVGKAERDRLFEALAIGTGSDPKSMTEPELRRCAVAISAIIKATPDVTPEEVSAACKKYHSVFSSASITTSAVANNWSKLVTRESGRKAVNLVDITKAPPFDWKRAIAIRYPRERYQDRRAWEEDNWELVPSNIKATIWSEGPKLLGL